MNVLKRLMKIAGCGVLLCGCAVTHGDYKTTTFVGGLYKRVSTGFGQTMQVNLMWIPVWKTDSP